jgi:hypothetical protein
MREAFAGADWARSKGIMRRKTLESLWAELFQKRSKLALSFRPEVRKRNVQSFDFVVEGLAGEA